MDAMYTATNQRIGFAFCIQVVRNFLAIDLQVDRVEIEILANVQRKKERDLGVGWKQQLFLKQEQVPVEIEHFLLQVLHILIKTAKLLARCSLGISCCSFLRDRCRAECQQQAYDKADQ